MPLINNSSKDEMLSQFTGYDHGTMAEASFDEVFSASLGHVIDEELSISHMLNREGWGERRERINGLIRSGEIPNVDKYRTNHGRNRVLDYDAIAKDLKRDDIKTDAQLNHERNETLRHRREYYESTVSRGTGAAQFLGAMNAYMLDPLNILTVGLAAPATTVKATTTLGRVMLASRNAALIEGGVELGIQSMVYQHKQDIGSPYSASDALANIAMAATGAGVLGGTTEGISGWLKQVLKKADELPQNADVVTAKAYLQRQQETLNGAPKVDVNQAKADILAQAGRDIAEQLENTPVTSTAKIAELEAELKAINKGKIPKSMEKALAEEVHARQVESDVEYLKEMDRRGGEYAVATKEQSTYERLTRPDEIESPAPPATASQREREILRAQGLDEVYDQEFAKFDQLETKTLEIDGEAVDAEALIKQFDDEIEGLDDVLKCAYGGGAKGGSDKLVSAFVGAFNAK
jgi:hypothetical protein